MTTRHQTAIAVLLIAMAGCGKSTSESAGDASHPVIQGEVTPSSYADAAEETLAHALHVINSETPTEKELDGNIGKIEALLALSEAKTLDAGRLHEADLLSTLGSLYAEKARIYKNTPRTGGELIAKSFRYLDKAIRLHPEDLNARINRGIVASNVPEFLGKTAIAHEDLLFVRNNAGFDGLPRGLQDRIKRLLAEVDIRLAKADLVQ